MLSAQVGAGGATGPRSRPRSADGGRGWVQHLPQEDDALLQIQTKPHGELKYAIKAKFRNATHDSDTAFPLKKSNYSLFRKIPDATTTRGRMWHSWSMINLYHTGSCLVLPMSSLYHDSDALLLKGWSLWQSRMVTTTKENRSKLVSCLGVQIEPGPSPISAILCDHAMFVITALWF